MHVDEAPRRGVRCAVRLGKPVDADHVARLTRRVVQLSAVVATLILAGCGGRTALSRPPTAPERAALQQTIEDWVAAHHGPDDPHIAGIRVATVPLGLPGPSPYSRFAVVSLWAPDAGDVIALVGYRTDPLPHWRVLDLGSARVSCNLGRQTFGSHAATVRRALALDCT
jgi:hypothetical protein